MVCVSVLKAKAIPLLDPPTQEDSCNSMPGAGSTEGEEEREHGGDDLWLFCEQFGLPSVDRVIKLYMELVRKSL